MAAVFNLHAAFLVLPLILDLFSHAVAERDENNWKHNWLYFEKVDIKCESDTLDGVVQFVHFWILPTGEIRRPAMDKIDQHVTLINDGFGLSIDKLDDRDFGIYYCVVQTGPNTTDVIRIGVNADGPFYGKEMIERFKRNAIIGGIAAGVMLLVLVTIWVLYSNVTCCNQADEEATPIVAMTSNGPIIQETQVEIEQDKLDGWLQTTKIGESIYDSADALKSVKAVEAPGMIPQAAGRHEDRLLSSDSGHYQTIGSLERDQRLLSESEISDDVKILKTVIRRDWSETVDPETGDSHATDNFEKIHGFDVGSYLNAIDQQSSAPVDGLNETITSTGNVDGDEVEYSVSAKARRQNKETVVIIDGDVILEPNGTSVTVTTVQSMNQTESLPKDNIVSSLNVSEYHANVETTAETAVVPMVQSTGDIKEASSPGTIDVPDTNGKTSNPVTEINGEEPHAKIEGDSKTEVDDARKISTASTPKSDADSNPSSSVDEDTVAKYQSVLASLVSKHSRSNSDSTAASVRGMGSRSSSNDSNVFHEEAIVNDGTKHIIDDVRF